MHDHAAIAAETALDGFYVLRTSVPAARCCLVRTRWLLQLLGIIRYAEKPPPGFRDNSVSLIARLNSFVIER
jgi:hypothetical protein